jgi:hypothetical protein
MDTVAVVADSCNNVNITSVFVFVYGGIAGPSHNPQPGGPEAVISGCSYRTLAVSFCDLRASSTLPSVGVYSPSQIFRF